MRRARRAKGCLEFRRGRPLDRRGRSLIASDPPWPRTPPNRLPARSWSSSSGDPTSDQIDNYQRLQGERAGAEAKKAGIGVEVVFVPGFDHLRTLRKRLGDTKAPRIDAVITEPASLSTMDLILRDLKGKTGLVLLNIWGALGRGAGP